MTLAESRPFKAAVFWLAVLAPFFYLSYGFANWVTGLRQHVPVVVFGWERAIPFLPWTIVPYWSTDLFYAASLFLCTTRAELHTQVKRLITVQVLCVSGFLLFPLRFSFVRPPAGGLFGDMFDALMSFDKPFNQAPSLHVAITAVLWAAYGRHFKGWMLWMIRAWFAIMALSTLTTYQHHFIDLPTGLWVGLLSMALFPQGGRRVRFARSRDLRRFPVGAAYFAAASICGLLAYRIEGLAWILLWPAGALAIVACIYWSGRPELFPKSNGIVLLAPYLALAWLSSRWYTRGQEPAQEIGWGVWLGRVPTRAELKAFGMASVVDVTAEFPGATEGVVYRSVPMLDTLVPGDDQLDAAVDAVEELRTSRPTLVHCALGYSRSALSVAAWLMATGKAPSAAQAVDFVRARRPYIVVRPAALAALEQWAATRVAK